MSFKGKVILITNASSIIGAAAVEFFAKEGALLALVGQKTERLVQAFDKVKANSIETISLPEEITIDADRIINETIVKFGRLDVLIHNSEIELSGSIENMEIIDFDIVMTTNVRNVIELTKKAIPYLIKSKGNIVVLSSNCSVTPFPNHLAYSISKASLDQFTKCAALELESSGVRINSIAPRYNITEFASNQASNKHVTTANRRDYENNSIEQINLCVKAIAFLAKDQDTFHSGKILQLPISRESDQSFDII
ncbi:uncharacterized protein LOC116343088 [Contarinia nasturtii]|uniref:uncharacterized protein LOC116343088 n=1 Tax=Contarinia nasturtii TaxID=265458 RepID=UPI0012D3C3CE|nr:uncharacterized protein LOC116343088 [Contarinia nasturtii]